MPKPKLPQITLAASVFGLATLGGYAGLRAIVPAEELTLVFFGYTFGIILMAATILIHLIIQAITNRPKNQYDHWLKTLRDNPPANLNNNTEANIEHAQNVFARMMRRTYGQPEDPR